MTLLKAHLIFLKCIKKKQPETSVKLSGRLRDVCSADYVFLNFSWLICSDVLLLGPASTLLMQSFATTKGFNIL